MDAAACLSQMSQQGKNNKKTSGLIYGVLNTYLKGQDIPLPI